MDSSPYNRHQSPLTPPMSSTFHSACRPVALPPISHFDRQLSAMHPLTPPDDLAQSSKQSVWDASPANIDWLDFTRNRSAHFIAEKTCEMICYLWFASSPVAKRGHKEANTGSLSRESTLVSGPPSRLAEGHPVNAYPSPNHSPLSPAHPPVHLSPSSPKPRSPPSHLQLVPTASFITFMQKLLETTQVSQSVIVLSLHYIYRLKDRNRFTEAQRGSEFRIAVAGLMMANKFLDDNTYTNKTWSEVSGIELEEINRMEREFLMGVDFNLYVDKPTYESWLNLLKGLVIAKEKDSARSRADAHRRRDSRKVTTNARTKAAEYQRKSSLQIPYSTPFTSSDSRRLDQPGAFCTPSRLPPLARAISPQYYPRARSTSPTQGLKPNSSLHGSHRPAPIQSPPHPRLDTNHCPSNKRTAEAAFSPTSASFAHLPSKRPTSMILQIPDSSFSTGMSAASHQSAGHSYSPLEGLSSFSQMSLAHGGDTSPERNQSSAQRHAQQAQSYHQQNLPPHPPPVHQEPLVPSTLVAPYSYSVENQRHRAQPQQLYYYTLASSPMDAHLRSRSRRQLSADMGLPSGAAGDHRAEDVSEGEDEEQDFNNGNRLRTRKGKLMRWARGAEAQPSSTYAYEYSSAYAGDAYRHHHQPVYGCYDTSSAQQHQHQQPSTRAAPRPECYSPSYGSNHLAASHNARLPSLSHPPPRPHIAVVQSALTSPTAMYMRGDLGYPGSCYGMRTCAESRPPTQQPRQQQPTAAAYPTPMTSSSTTQWYSASYHPSPVQSSLAGPAYPDSLHPPRTIYSAPHNAKPPSTASTAMPVLPQQNDHIWARPPAVVSLAAARRQEEAAADEDSLSDSSSEGYMDTADVFSSAGPSVRGISYNTTAPTTYYPSAVPSHHSSAKPAYTQCPSDQHHHHRSPQYGDVPSAPFANAGPAGVHVAFGDYSPYGHHGSSGYAYGYPEHCGQPQQHQQQQQGCASQSGHHRVQQRYASENWASRGHREY